MGVGVDDNLLFRTVREDKGNLKSFEVMGKIGPKSKTQCWLWNPAGGGTHRVGMSCVLVPALLG